MAKISPQELQQLLIAQPNLPLIDVRTPAEYAKEHIPQARNEPLTELNPKALYEAGVLTKGQPVYLLCQGGGRATKAFEKFERDGYHHGVIIEGGTQAWIDAGFPVERSDVKIISLERQIRIAAGSLVLTGVLLSIFVNRGFIGLSGFVGAGLIFAGITDWCGLGLLLAKAPWNVRRN